MSGPPFRTENNGPYDFAGGTVASASTFDTNTIQDVAHTTTAALDFTTGGTSVVHANFTVQNQTTPPSLACNPPPLSLAAQQNGSPVSQTPTLSASTGTASFTPAESAPWLSVSPGSGATPATITFTANPAGLAPGG